MAKPSRYTRQRQTIVDIIAAELRTNPHVEAILLYGSFPRGTAHRASDIDMLIVGSPDADDIKHLVPRRWRRRLSLTIRSYADIQPGGRSDWSLLTQVREHGQIVYASERVLAEIQAPRPPREALIARLERNAALVHEPYWAYRVARRCLYLANAAASVYHYDRDAACAAFIQRHPSVVNHVNYINDVYHRPPWLRRLRRRIPSVRTHELQASAVIIDAARAELNALAY